MSGTSWLLGGGYPWQSADPAADRAGSKGPSVLAAATGGLVLRTEPAGPLGLLSGDDSLGRLTLPRGVAVDGNAVFVLSDDGARVLRYDPVRATLVPLREIGAETCDPSVAGSPDGPRRFLAAANVAALGGELHVADPAAGRVQVFDARTLALLRIHPGLAPPLDVAAGSEGVYILAAGAGRVYRASPGRESLVLVVDVGAAAPWDRIAIDREERIYARVREEDGSASLRVFGPGDSPPPITDAAEVRDRFAEPAIHTGPAGELVLPERLLDPCGLRSDRGTKARSFAIGDRLYVVDRETLVLGVLLSDGRVRHRFGPYDGRGIETTPDAEDVWSPSDVVALSRCAAILDERHQVVWAHEPGDERLRRWFAAPQDSGRRWRRIAADPSGCLLLWDGVGDSLDRVDPDGRILGSVPAREARSRFERAAPPPPPPAVRLTRAGALPRPPAEPPVLPAPTFVRSGVWTSRWLDSDLYNCRWHVLEVAVTSLPPGSRMKLRTRTSNEPQSDFEALAEANRAGTAGSWRSVSALSGIAQPSEEERKPSVVDFLVPSGPGRYLQLQIELEGDGLASPVLGSARIRFPRESLLEYLPAVYSKPEEQREFLDRFLAIPQTTWAAIEREVETFERYLDPDSVPPAAMECLAGWLAVRLEGTWEPEQNRKILQAMPGLRARWGTVEGLRAWLRVYLSVLSGWSVEQLEQAGVPGIVESFVERRRLLLGRGDVATLCAAEALFGPSLARRFQVGVFDRESEVELVSTGDPDLDLFHRHAHSFRVHVPAAWVRSPAEEALLRRAIDAQKPAHATYELVLVEAAFRIGVQSTLDLDAVIGSPFPGPVPCSLREDAPSRSPHGRLGYDTVLGGERSGAPAISSAAWPSGGMS